MELIVSLPIIYKALGSTPSTKKKQKKPLVMHACNSSILEAGVQGHRWDTQLKARPSLKVGGREGGGRGQEKSPARHGSACL